MSVYLMVWRDLKSTYSEQDYMELLHTCFIILWFHEKTFQPQTRATHQAHCSSLGGPLHDHIATTKLYEFVHMQLFHLTGIQYIQMYIAHIRIM